MARKFTKIRKGKSLLLISFLLLFLFLFGCVKKVTPVETGKIVSRYVTPEGTFLSPNPCLMMVCENMTGVPAFFKWIFGGKPTLFKGKCELRTFDPFDPREVNKTESIIKGEKNEYIRSFMIGQGPNLAAADEAQRFCDGNLGFAVHNLGGNKTIVPKAIDKSSMECTLENDIIPLLIYGIPERDKGLNYTKELAKNISGIGPVFVSPGGEYNTTSGLENPSLHFCILKEKCKNCFVTAMIKLGDNETLATYNKTVGHWGEIPRKCEVFKAIDKIDIVGYGININDFDCDKIKVVDAVRNFSEKVMKDWEKPTILVYVKANETPVCTADKIASSYEALYSNIPFFSQVGLLGMANEDLADLFDDKGNQKNPMFSSWFQNCKIYYNQSSVYRAPQVPLMFPLGANGSPTCTALSTLSLTLYMRCEIDYSNISNIEPVDPIAFCSDFCFKEKILKEAGEIEIKLDKDAGKILDGYEKYCELWSQQIRQFSNEFEVDLSIARAIIWEGNGFDKEKQVMKTGPECISCNSYTGKIKEMCCGIERLSYYQGLVKEKLKGKSFCNYSKDFNYLHLAIYGYLTDESMVDIAIMDAENQAKRLGRDCLTFHYRGEVRRIIAKAQRLREVCGICKDERGLKEKEVFPWEEMTLPTRKIQSPLKTPNCTVGFGKNMGLYWSTGILLKDEYGENNVTAVEEGIVREVGFGSRRFGYIIIEGKGLTVAYSNLFSIEKKVGEAVSVGKKIGEIRNFLRLEVCPGLYSDCTKKDEPPFAIKRTFIDPAPSLGLTCPE